MQAPPVAVCLTGPESSGKSTLAQALAEQLSLPRVAEAARSLLVPNQPYSEADLIRIAAAQLELERDAMSSGQRVILDTDLTVIAIWWRVRFAESEFAPWPDWLASMFTGLLPRHYLLCVPDLPWEPDPLRESADDRDSLLERYQRLLRSNPFPWMMVSGTGTARLRSAQAALGAMHHAS